MVVWVGGAVRAVVAVDVAACDQTVSTLYNPDIERLDQVHGHTRVTLVCVALELVTALGEAEVLLWDDLIQSVGTTTEDLAGVAVAEDVLAGVLVESDSPLSLAAAVGQLLSVSVPISRRGDEEGVLTGTFRGS